METKLSVVPIIVFALGIGMTGSVAVAALVPMKPDASAHQGGYYSHPIYAHITNSNLVCGNRPCGPFQTYHPPKSVKPVGF